ncbi:hypothetical protein [Sphingomonas sp.]|uniref:hypothetical protein n=1 Tax=Sphingomonas sp. TaxID=28214 RepID=UPI0025FF9329|nr:hypothetical protein [Sphingomonas sp.]
MHRNGKLLPNTLARSLAAVALLVALIPLLVGLVRYCMIIHGTILYPYELDYGEGIVWQQMNAIVAGHGYGPIDVFPSIVFHYPPVYHLLAAGLATATGLDPLAAGRLLSIMATLATGGVTVLIVSRVATANGADRLAWICGLIGGLLIFSMMPILHWSRFMRVDMVALLLTLAGLYLGLRALSQPRAVHLAALCFVAAMFTKQTSLAAPIAVFATLLFLRPRTAWAGIATGAASGCAALAVLVWQTNGGFLDHILLYNINRIELGNLRWVVTMMTQHALFIGVALCAIGQSVVRGVRDYRHCQGFGDVRRTLTANPGHGQSIILLVYFLLTTVMLLLIVKQGSTYNYFIEWLCAVALFAGLAVSDAAVLAAGKIDAGRSILVPLVLPLAIGLQAILLPDTPLDAWRMTTAHRAEMDRLSALVRAAPKPIISDDMVVLLRSGKTVQWEPAIFSELGLMGVWDERPFIAKIHKRDFSFFITRRVGPDALNTGSFNPKVAAAIAAAYPVVRVVAGYSINLPPEPPHTKTAPGT